MSRRARTPAPPTRVAAPSRRGTRATEVAGLALVAVAVIALAVYSLAWRRIGDTAAEGDFYAGYAFGARQLLRGHLDFGRFGVFGPVYELLLAAVATMVHDLFAAARVLSVLAAGTTLLAWWDIARHRMGTIAALAIVALLLLNPTFVRYGYSATTDGVGLAFLSLSAWAALAPRRRWSPGAAGVLAGLATLTRYNLATILPAGVLLLALEGSRPWRTRGRGIAEFLAGALIVLAPWTLASLAAGHVPGITLLQDRGYYGAADPAGVLEERYRDITAGIGAVPRGDTREALALFATSLARGVLPHLAQDATDLLGLPVTVLALLGLAASLLRRDVRRFAPFLPLAAFTFLPLVPVYYSLRYALVLLPLELLPAAYALESLARVRWPLPARAGATAVLALAVLVPTGSWSLAQHTTWLAELPVEMRAAGEAIRPQVHAGQRLLARKAHVAYYAGLEPAPFPLVAKLETLAHFCRTQGVSYVYYSGIEVRARPAFGFLLDTTAAVPGLSVMYASEAPPCVVYRIGPGFGATPAWWSDATARHRIAARVNALLGTSDDTR